MQLFHGSHNGNTAIHEGACWTTDADAAYFYANDGIVLVVEVDEDALSTVECDGYDRDEDTAPCDSSGFRAELGCDLASYDDEDERGNEHDCIRICSDVAIAAFVAATPVAMSANQFCEEYR